MCPVLTRGVGLALVAIYSTSNTAAPTTPTSNPSKQCSPPPPPLLVCCCCVSWTSEWPLPVTWLSHLDVESMNHTIAWTHLTKTHDMHIPPNLAGTYAFTEIHSTASLASRSRNTAAAYQREIAAPPTGCAVLPCRRVTTTALLSSPPSGGHACVAICSGNELLRGNCGAISVQGNGGAVLDRGRSTYLSLSTEDGGGEGGPPARGRGLLRRMVKRVIKTGQVVGQQV